VQVALETGPGLPARVVGDPVRIGQVLGNLIGNALKFTAGGGITVGCRLEGSSAESFTLRLSIADTGIGIAPHALEAIFDKFSQADSSTTRLYGGTGLGLSISKSLVELMGGEIIVESSPGKGSVFSFTVVLGFPKPGEVPLQEAEEEGDIRAKIRLRILVVDDIPVNQLISLKLIAKTGDHLVDCAGNGREAIEKWEHGEYDLIFMDVQMPVMDGLEATRTIRNQEEATGRKVHICAMTANAMKEDVTICRQAGMDSYISKPVRERDIYAVVRRIAAGGEAAPHPCKAGAEQRPEAQADMRDSSDVFDRKGFLERFDGAEACVERFVEMFIGGVSEHLVCLGEALQQGDTATVHFRTHTIGGTAANMGAPRIQAIAAQMESLAKGEDLKDLSTLYGQLQDAFTAFKSVAASAAKDGE
jgi:CheY-like chemotaxis protein/HPt (histidine-containing phosphotransfer) domain-containing protein